jgi:protein-disulfide isomerase
MHDLLFSNSYPYSLERVDLDRYARQLGLDMTRFGASMDMHTHAADIDADMELARRLGATGTPMFFLNGTRLSGAQPLDRFTSIASQILTRAGSISPREIAYSEMVASPVAGGEPATPTTTRRADENDTTVYRVPVAGSPVRGSSDALVTIVEFSDFQCPFCQRVEATLDRVRTEYGRDVRIVWKNNPLPFHPNARPAAEAALEARAQQGDAGFWRFHDALYAAQREGIGREALERIAHENGLNASRFSSALDHHVHNATIDADAALAHAISSGGTPTFYINGRVLTGAQPFEAFQRAIDSARTEALRQVAQGTPRSRVYDTLIAQGATSRALQD